MNRGDAVDGETGDAAEVSHAHHGGGSLLFFRFLFLFLIFGGRILGGLGLLCGGGLLGGHVVLEDAHGAELRRHLLLGGVGVRRLDGGDELLVDALDDLDVAGEELLHELEGPLLESLGHDGVVGVRHSLGGERPRLVPVHALDVDEDAHELGGGEGRVGVVHLDGDLFGEGGPVGVAALLEAGDDILHGGRAEHVLLGEAQRLTLAGAVAGVEHGAELLGEVGLLHGLLVVAGVERGEVELLGRHLGVPEAEGDAVLGLVAGDRRVVRDSVDVGAGDPLAVHNLTIEANLVRGGALHLPRIAHLEPVVGVLHLLASLGVNGLLEETILVAETVAPRGKVEGGDGVEEARGEAAETTVTEAHVALDARAVLEGIAEGAERVGVLADETEVADGVGERTALEVLHGDVVRLLGVLLMEVLVGSVPVLDELLADGLGGRAVHVGDVEGEGHGTNLLGLVGDVVGDGLRGLGRGGSLGGGGGVGGDV